MSGRLFSIRFYVLWKLRIWSQLLNMDFSWESVVGLNVSEIGTAASD